MVQYLLYTFDTPIERVKEFARPTKLIMPLDEFDEQKMVMIKSRFGLQTLHTNTYLVKTSDDVFLMSKESFDELLIDEIENI